MYHAAVTVTKTTPDDQSIAKHISTIIYQSQTTKLVNHSSSTNIIISPACSHSDHTIAQL